MDTTNKRREAYPDAIGEEPESEGTTEDDHALHESFASVRTNLSSQERPLDQYKMDHEDRGYAIIFNNREFEDKKLKERSGTDMDLKRIISLLQNDLGFKKDHIKYHHNVEADRMKQLIVDAAGKDYTNSDCFICVILSYGTKAGDIHGCDGREPISLNELIDELIEPLKGKEFQPGQSLIGKPKLFFVQACPCGKGNQGGDNSADATGEEGLDLGGFGEMVGVRIPSEADFLVALSSVPGSLGRKGSSFIQTLNEVVKARRDTDDLLSLLTKVNNKIVEKSGNVDSVEVPYVKSMLTKKVFFNKTQ